MPDNNILLELTSDIVTALLSNSSVPGEQLPSLMTSVYSSLSNLGQEAQDAMEQDKPAPAVTARRSLADPDVLVSMIDGKPYSSLKRHITKHGYTPESYREAFKLRSDYPMVAPGYSERRREIAKTLGLGRKPAAEVVLEVVAAEPTPQKKPRKSRKAGTKTAEPTGE